MTTQRQIPGGLYVNETGTRQAQIPGGAYVNETGAAGPAAITGANATQVSTSGSGAVTSSAGATLTTSALKNNTGTLLANQTGITVHVYQLSGALVVTKTGQTTNASGVMSISDVAIVAATQYRIVIVLSTGAEGMDKVTAS